MNSNGTISVYAPAHLDPYDSYGLIGCELVRHWNRVGIKTNVFALGHAQHPNQDEEVARYVQNPISASMGGIMLGYPTVYPAYGPLAQRSPRIALTMFESTRIPEGWANILNDCDCVITPSAFCQDVFEDSGVTVPIRIARLGIDQRYKPVEREPKDVLTFLTFLDRGRRKGGTTAIEAFAEEFGHDMSVQLIVKRRRRKRDPEFRFTNPNIHVVDKDLSADELYQLYLQCDCLLNPNRGEGYGLIPREFAATGGVSLATSWGGTAEKIHLWGWPIDFTLVPADWQGIPKLENQDLGLWAEPSKDDLMARMRSVYMAREDYFRQAYKKAKHLRDIFSWAGFSYTVHKIWEEVAHGNYSYTAA